MNILFIRSRNIKSKENVTEENNPEVKYEYGDNIETADELSKVLIVFFFFEQ